MQLGIRYYVKDLQKRLPRVLKAAERVLERADRNLPTSGQYDLRGTVQSLRRSTVKARQGLTSGRPMQEVTWEFQRRVGEISAGLVARDLRRMREDLLATPNMESVALAASLAALEDDSAIVAVLTTKDWSPLAAMEGVCALVASLDMGRDEEAQPVLPMATISVTEDMATSMRLHALGWRSVYYDKVLARGLAPEDLRTALQQRLRWAQGTVQVFLRESPLTIRGLSLGQRLMYLGTIWGYLQGFFSVIYLSLPIIFMFTGIAPVRAFDTTFFWHLVPYLVLNQLMFMIVAWGKPTLRGQQYNLALFPVWIQSVTSAIANVYFGKKLGFAVTSKTRQTGISVRLIQWQLVFMAATVAAIIYGVASIALGRSDAVVSVLVNVAWAIYNLVLVSVVVWAALYRPKVAQAEAIPDSQALPRRGRAGAGVH